MPSSTKKLIIANWKMFGNEPDVERLATLVDSVKCWKPPAPTFVICPPFTLLKHCVDLLSHSSIAIGAQNHHDHLSGPYTGEISASMLAALGVSYALLGHAERRLLAKEDDALIARKTAAGQKASLTNIVCFGEPMLIQQMEETLQYLKHQIIHSLPESFDPKRIILAYEPVWAIGTGKTPSVKHLTQLFKALRAFLSETFPNDAYSMRIVYGGSVNTKLAHMLAEIKDLDGLLIGRLSLNPDEMIKIASEFCRI